MSDYISETIAQLQHENLKLLDELNYLKEHTLSLEETLNVQCSELLEERKHLKSLDQQNDHLNQLVKEKDNLIDSLEQDKRQLIKLNSELSSEKLSFKGELLREKVKSKQLEALRFQEDELKEACGKLRQENQRLNAELSLKSEECYTNAATIKDLMLHIKELEKEITEFRAVRESLVLREKEERLNTSENLECFLRKSPEWSRSQMNLYHQSEQNSTQTSSKEGVNLNLREEILEVEVREKQIKIGQLESLLRRKEEEELERSQTVDELKRKLSNAGLSNYNSKIDLKLDSSAFSDMYNLLLKLINWPEGHSGECKSVAEVASLSVAVKEEVQSTQPSSIRLIETVSIASQTDPIKNLSPVLLFKSFEKLERGQNLSDSENEEEEEESPSLMEDRVRKGSQPFSEIKNSNLDMDIYSMSKQSETNGSNLHLSEVSSASDRDSDNSRDVNLNSKKFVDCNLIGIEKNNKNEESDLNSKISTNENSVINVVDVDKKEKRESTEKKEESLKVSGNNANLENSITHFKNNPVTNHSTPKPQSIGSQALCTSFSISPESSLEQENGTQTYLVAKNILAQIDNLSNEEIDKKFQELSFAFRTDSMTIPKRLHLMKRRRDQAETNIENELTTIKTKLKTLQYLGLNSEYVNLMTDLKKQLDFVLNAVVQLSSSAESYGYTQHEEKFLEFGTSMLQHVEKIESSKSNPFKTSEKQKSESKRSQPSISLDVEGVDEKILRRRSVTAATVQTNSRRRASIATLPRTGPENNQNGKGFQWTPARSPGCLVKKLSFSQGSSRSNGNGVPGMEESGKDSNSSRHRKESRNSEGTMKNIEEFEERPSTNESEELLLQELPSLEGNNSSDNDSSLQLRQLFESIEETRRSGNAQERVSPINCLRRIIEWNKLLINSSRFRWPETNLQYVPFYITWYIILVLVLVFMSGLFTGMNGCYTYSCLKYSALWFAVPPLFNFTRRFYRFLLPLLFTFLLALTLIFLWLTEVLLPQLNNEEVDALFKTFGLEIRYLYGPPPV